jgi:hypothetical protein
MDNASTTPFRILPAIWLYICEKALENKATIEWATVRERNNSHFTLQPISYSTN